MDDLIIGHRIIHHVTQKVQPIQNHASNDDVIS